nr:DAN domain family member 5 [Camelus dromedarius]
MFRWGVQETGVLGAAAVESRESPPEGKRTPSHSQLWAARTTSPVASQGTSARSSSPGQTDATQPAASVLTTLLSPLNGTWLPIGSARPGPQGPPPQPWAAANQTQALDQGAPTFLVPSSALGSCKAFLGLQKTGQQGTGRLQCGRHCVSAAGPTGSGPGIVPGCALHSTENKIEKVPVFRCSPGWGSFYIPGLDPFLLILCNSCVPACKYWVPVVLWCWRGSPASCQRVKTFTVLVNGCQCSPKA